MLAPLSIKNKKKTDFKTGPYIDQKKKQALMVFKERRQAGPRYRRFVRVSGQPQPFFE